MTVIGEQDFVPTCERSHEHGPGLLGGVAWGGVGGSYLFLTLKVHTHAPNSLLFVSFYLSLLDFTTWKS